jgi:para-nitrobenzyl esterase
LPGSEAIHGESRSSGSPQEVLGVNSDDGTADGPARPIDPAEFEQTVRARFGSAAQPILDAYPHQTRQAAIGSLRDLARDGEFAWHAWTWARVLSEKHKAKAFVYYFDVSPAGSTEGAPHGLEVPYVFGNLGVRTDLGIAPPQASEAARKTSDLMQSYWINFAAQGDPNGPGLPVWPAFDAARPSSLYFGASIDTRTLPNLAKLQALEGYFKAQREPRVARQ